MLGDRPHKLSSQERILRGLGFEDGGVFAVTFSEDIVSPVCHALGREGGGEESHVPAFTKATDGDVEHFLAHVGCFVHPDAGKVWSAQLVWIVTGTEDDFAAVVENEARRLLPLLLGHPQVIRQLVDGSHGGILENRVGRADHHEEAIPAFLGHGAAQKVIGSHIGFAATDPAHESAIEGI